jgi:NADH-quinone oxidoreductase subunit H
LGVNIGNLLDLVLYLLNWVHIFYVGSLDYSRSIDAFGWILIPLAIINIIITGIVILRAEIATYLGF